MPSRATDLTEFIRKNGWDTAARESLAGDASPRRYDRLIDLEGGRSAVLMDASLSTGESVGDFASIDRILRGYGFSAPEILAMDADKGFMLLEDLGDALMARVCADNPVMEQEFYKAAIDLLVELHRHPAPVGLPEYDLAAYLRETRLLTDWYIPNASSRGVTSESLQEYDLLISTLCKPLENTPRILTQRDYHSENLLWLPDREGFGRVGLLDFQDALAGHPAYDLVSLLEDARRDTSTSLQELLKKRYLKAAQTNAKDFELAYCTLGAQRNLKIIGIFTRLHVLNGKFTYLDLIPRVWAHLQRDLAHPGLGALRDWVSENVPEPTPAILLKIRGNS